MIRMSESRFLVQAESCADMREYTDYIRVKLTKDDRRRIREKMEEAGITNMSAYIRKMAIDGYLVKLDLSDMNEVARLLRINSNNINQYAKRANESGSIYLEDIKEIQNQQERLWESMKKILQRLSTI